MKVWTLGPGSNLRGWGCRRLGEAPGTGGFLHPLTPHGENKSQQLHVLRAWLWKKVRDGNQPCNSAA